LPVKSWSSQNVAFFVPVHVTPSQPGFFGAVDEVVRCVSTSTSGSTLASK
jgi:hypothetical protein